MGALLSLPLTILNALLPFTNPKTPLLQDLIHTAILCGTLYYAPQLVEHYNNAVQQHQPSPPTHEPAYTNGDATAEDDTQGGAIGRRESHAEDLPLADDLILQPDTDAEDNLDADPPPLAPTPPPPFDQQQQQQHQFPPDAFAEAGPANPAPVQGQQQGPRPTPANRTIGTKKAKSLARKDQRRAYHEFHRQEAELRRLRDAEGASEREAALQAEKARRAEVEREIAEREREAREKKKEEERREVEEEQERRDRVVRSVREAVEKRGAVNLVELAGKEGKDRGWVERVVRASGVLSQLGQSDSSEDARASAVIITGSGWVVRVDNALMQKVYADAVAFGNRNGGKVGFEAFGLLLEKAVRAKAMA